MKPITKIFKPGSYLFRENDRSRELFIIQSGTVNVCEKNGAHGIKLAQLSKGAVLGEMSLIDGKPRSASAKAIDECTSIIIYSETFFNNISEVPQNPLASFLFKINSFCSELTYAPPKSTPSGTSMRRPAGELLRMQIFNNIEFLQVPLRGI